MSDNVSVTAGTGTSIASDDVGGVQFQIVKIDVGGDGVSTPLSTTNPLPVNTAQTEDVAHVSGDKGVMALAVRKDIAGALAGTDGDYSPLQVDSSGALRIVGQAVTQYAEDAGHSNGDLGVLSLVVRKDAAGTLAGSDGDYAPLQLDSTGNLRVRIAGDDVGSTLDTEDGSVASGQGNVALVVALPYQFNGSAWVRGGSTPYKLISAATTNATNLKGSAGVVCMVLVENTNASPRYLKFYNKATAPTVGTDVPVQVYTIPGSATGAGVAVPIPSHGLAFSTGIGFAITTGATDADTGAVAINEIIVNCAYI